MDRRTTDCELWRWFEDHHAEWWNRQIEQVTAAMGSDGRRADSAEIALTAAVIKRGIAIEDLIPVAAPWHPNPIVMARQGREVADDEKDVPRTVPLAEVSQDAAFGIVGINPLEPIARAITLMQRRLATVERVKVA